MKRLQKEAMHLANMTNHPYQSLKLDVKGDCKGCCTAAPVVVVVPCVTDATSHQDQTTGFSANGAQSCNNGGASKSQTKAIG